MTGKTVVEFTAMKNGDQADYDLLVGRHVENAKGVADQLWQVLVDLKGTETGCKIDRLSHSLQSASRAWHDGAEFSEIRDQHSFDLDAPDLPLFRVEPILRRDFDRSPNDPAALRPGERVALRDTETAKSRQ